MSRYYDCSVMLIGGIMLSFFCIMLSSCSTKSTANEAYFTENNKIYELSDVLKEDTLKSTLILEERVGAYNLCVVDSLICFSTTDKAGMFGLYSLRGDSLATIGKFGEGPNDFTSSRTIGQTFRDVNQIGVWVVDVNSAKLKRLNITASLASGDAVIDQVCPIEPMVKNAFVLNESKGCYDIAEEIMDESGYSLKLIDKTGKVNSESLYLIPFDKSDLFMAYNATWRMSEDDRYIVIAMLGINQLNIIDLQDDRNRIAVTVGNVKKQEDVLDKDSHTPIWTYYSNVTLSHDRIFAIYENQSYQPSEDGIKKPCDLHVFTFEGELKAIIPLDQFIYAVSYSSKDNSLYCLGENENLYRYDLSSLKI